MYIGNLESYQGIDLLIEGFAMAVKQQTQPENPDISLIVIGGTPETINAYREKCGKLGLANSVVFAGPKPFSDLEAYMDQVDILVSPRTQGENTPMKIYNYMASGVLLTGFVALLFFKMAVVTGEGGQIIGLTNFGNTIYASGLKWVLMLAPLGVVFYMSFGIAKMSASKAQTTFCLLHAKSFKPMRITDEILAMLAPK